MQVNGSTTLHYIGYEFEKKNVDKDQKADWQQGHHINPVSYVWARLEDRLTGFRDGKAVSGSNNPPYQNGWGFAYHRFEDEWDQMQDRAIKVTLPIDDALMEWDYANRFPWWPVNGRQSAVEWRNTRTSALLTGPTHVISSAYIVVSIIKMPCNILNLAAILSIRAVAL